MSEFSFFPLRFYSFSFSLGIFSHLLKEQLSLDTQWYPKQMRNRFFQTNAVGFSVVICHLLPFVLECVAVERVRRLGGTHALFWSTWAENGLSPPVALQLALRGQLDPVGEVLQRAVLEAVACAQGFGKGERDPTLEEPVLGPDVLVHVRVDGRPRRGLASSPLRRPQCWNILGRQTRGSCFRDQISTEYMILNKEGRKRSCGRRLINVYPHVVPVKSGKEAEIRDVRDATVEHQHLLVNHCRQR